MATVPPSTPAPAPPGSAESSEAGDSGASTGAASAVVGRPQHRSPAVSRVLGRWSSLPRVLVDLVRAGLAMAKAERIVAGRCQKSASLTRSPHWRS